MYLIQVLIEHPVHALDRTFTYLYNNEIQSGVRVKVHFHNQTLVGYVVDVSYTNKSKEILEEEYGYQLLYIQSVIDDIPLLNEELLLLADKLSDMTLAPLISCYQTMLPTSLKPNTHKEVRIKTQKVIRVIRDGQPKTKKQLEALETLKGKETFLTDCKYSKVLLDNLKKQGFIDIIDVEIRRDPYKENDLKIKNDIVLTKDQQYIVDHISSQTERKALIHGVTGSGKTEVYIALTRETLKRGKTVIMLVPEISLTPMMVTIFKERFGDKVAILHSRLSEGERYDEYRRIKNQEVSIVVGARSAIFAPLENIGLIILDEEHDSSYKQENTPRYLTSTIAFLRGQYHHANVVMGSATPNVETYARAKKGIYDYYELSTRINKKPLPEVLIVDMSTEAKKGHYDLFSHDMIQGISDALNKGEQAIIMLNRRGYASFVKCDDCGHIVRCPHCDVTLTYHKDTNRLQCHYCEYQTKMIDVCPECHSPHLKKIGVGTQRVEERVERLFPGKRVQRFDFDATRGKNKHTKLLEDFGNKKIDILVGTQMISKGLDFPNVTFVGVLSADITLTLPDYKASERTFQLLTQVAGRSGRGEKTGRVVIQTYNPDHYAIKYGAAQDYFSFYKEEIAFRQLAYYPPYCRLVSVIIQSKHANRLEQATSEIETHLKNVEGIKCLGPYHAHIYKMHDIYRNRFLIKYTNLFPLMDTLRSLTDYYNKKGNILVVCDFHPYTQI